MIDIASLQRVLPKTGLEPQELAFIGGFAEMAAGEWSEPMIYLLEPPAGQQVPFVDPVKTMAILLRHQGLAPAAATAQARDRYAALRPHLTCPQRIRYYNFLDPDSPECIPFPVLLAYLQDTSLVAEDVIDFLARAADVAIRAPIFKDPDNWDTSWTLADIAERPLPKSMIQFIPGAPWVDLDKNGHSEDHFLQWREAIRPVAAALEQAHGEPVYYFKDPDCDYDDDNGHRFLVLHWCATYWPESPYVKFLMEACGATDVDAFRAALIAPASYVQPFEMNDAFFALEAGPCRIMYFPPTVHKVVGVVFATAPAQRWAESLLRQQINAEVLIVAPKMLATDEWLQNATRNCRNWEVQYFDDGMLQAPIDLLARIDELRVVAEEKRLQGDDLKLAPSIEELLWQAIQLQLPAKYFHTDGAQFMNPEDSLRRRDVPERVAVQNKQRQAFTQHLGEIRLECDYGSGGLWDKQGKMLGYYQLAIPFPLVRRLAAWQRDFENTAISAVSTDDAGRERRERKKPRSLKSCNMCLARAQV